MRIEKMIKYTGCLAAVITTVVVVSCQSAAVRQQFLASLEADITTQKQHYNELLAENQQIAKLHQDLTDQMADSLGQEVLEKVLADPDTTLYNQYKNVEDLFIRIQNNHSAHILQQHKCLYALEQLSDSLARNEITGDIQARSDYLLSKCTQLKSQLAVIRQELTNWQVKYRQVMQQIRRHYSKK
jgi:regulator of replication initiation timing